MVRRADAPALIAAAPLLTILGWWTFAGGGYAPTVWEPGGVVLVLLLVVLWAARALLRPRRRVVLVAIAALAAYAGWSLLSILWADAPGVAYQGGLRTVTYLALFAAPALLPWTPRALLITLGGWVAVVTAAGVTVLLALLGGDPLSQTIDARLAEPLGYMNADPALWTMAALPALALAARRQTPFLLRPLLLGAAALLVELAVLSQSRGWLFTLPVVLGLALVVVPGRLRLAIFSVPAGVAVALSVSDLLDPFEVGGGIGQLHAAGPLREALHQAAGSAVVGALVAVGLGAAFTAIDRFAPIPRPLRRAAAPIGAVLAAAVVLGGLAAAVAATDGHPVERAQRAWADFKDYKGGEQAGAARFSRLGSSRYDFWRVALDAWRDHPALGLGQDNFAEEYLRRRDSSEEPRWTHSLELRLLTHTGVIGAALFALFAGAAIAAAGVLRRHRPGRQATALALLPGIDWVVHGSVDWLWEYPALAGAAVAFAGAAAGLGDRLARRVDEPRRAPRRALPLRPVAVGAGVAAAVASTAALATAFLAERNADLAVRTWRTEPERALQRLDRARALDPLSERAPLLQGLIAEQLGRPGAAREALGEAARRAPEAWLVQFELGLLPGRGAAGHLRRAQGLNPREPLVAEALRRERSGRPMTPVEAARRFQERIDRRIGR